MRLPKLQRAIPGLAIDTAQGLATVVEEKRTSLAFGARQGTVEGVLPGNARGGRRLADLPGGQRPFLDRVTLAAQRRRGIRPEAIRTFFDEIGVTKVNGSVDLARYEYAVRNDLNAIAPIITMFFMVTYGTINLACFYESFTRNPTYRPAFKLAHWSTALLGAVGCVGVMLLISPVSAIVAILAMAARASP